MNFEDTFNIAASELALRLSERGKIAFWLLSLTLLGSRMPGCA
jgi:hypothetical protein